MAKPKKHKPIKKVTVTINAYVHMKPNEKLKIGVFRKNIRMRAVELLTWGDMEIVHRNYSEEVMPRKITARVKVK